MRIVSLLPSTTEIVYALGLGAALVGVTHECDFPADARSKPVVTRSLLDHTGATSEEIDHAVRRQLRDGLSLYALDQAQLKALAPELILTQALCEVCAVAYSQVERAVRDVSAEYASLAPHVLSLEPNSLEDILATVRTIAAAAGVPERAAPLLAGWRERIARVQTSVAHSTQRPRVACLEWLDSIFGPGHWLPELIELAGGQAGLGTMHADSRRVAWGDVIAFAPEVIILTPCGFDLDHTIAEAQRVLPNRPGWAALPAVRHGRVYAVDGNAYFSRPGPRIIESLELMAELLHPEYCAGYGPPGAWQTIDLLNISANA